MDFAIFANLRQLNLSHNQLRDILPFRLDKLPKLSVLDLSFNKINNPISMLAQHFDVYPALEVLCLRGNESFHSSKHRMELIGKMAIFKQMDCKLTVVDTPVTITERIQAWLDQGGSQDSAEELKIKYQLQSRLPLNLLAEEVRFINLNRADLVIFPDLQVYSGLQCLTLRHNNLTTILPVMELKTLRLLDVRENKLSVIDECVKVVNALPRLEVFAALGNLFSQPKFAQKYRQIIISNTPKLREIENAFQFIDDSEITTEEILQSAFPRARNEMETQKLGRWQWAVCLWREVSTLPDPSQATQLDLSSHGLSHCGLTSGMFLHIRRLSLANNKLTNFELTKITTLESSLEELDISSNQITELNAIGKLVDSLPRLKCLWADKNSAFKDDSDVSRCQFLSHIEQTQYLGAPLRVLNGFPIFVGERIKGLEAAKLPNLSQLKLEEFRTELALEASRAKEGNKQLYLNGYELTDLKPIISFANVEFLDLSSNSLTTLVDQGLEKLPKLFWLDLRENSFNSVVESIVKPLMLCHRLRHLYLQRSTKHGDTNKVSDYVINPVFQNLRGLESCDQSKNPHKMDANGDAGADFLFAHYGISRNSLVEINLNNRGLQEDEFPQFCTALSYVYCTKLSCAENPWASVPNYRFMLIHFGKTLQELDGQKVRMDERANAQRAVQAMKFDKKLYYLDRATEIGLQGLGFYQGAAFADDTTTGGQGQELIYTTAVGTVLSKTEIVINFLQVFAILFTLTIEWPNWWYQLNIRWIYLIDINLSFDWLTVLSEYQYVIKFLVLALLPVVIFLVYNLDPREEKWISYYVTQSALSWKIHICEVVLSGLLSLYCGYVIDYIVLSANSDKTSWERLRDGSGATGLCKSLIAAVFGLSMLYQIFRILLVRSFRNHHKSTTYWFSFIKMKKKMALFCLTVSYQPIARNALVHFAERDYQYESGGWVLGKLDVDQPECMTASDMTKIYSEGDSYCCQAGMPDRACMTAFADLEWFHYVSFFLCIAYIAGIPYFVYRQIREGIHEIDVNYNVPQKIAEMEAREAKLKAAIQETISRREKKKLRKEVKKNRKQFRAQWYRYCREYTNAQNYLYFSYTRQKRYTKVVIMFEKLILLAVLLFFSTAYLESYKIVAGMAVTGIYFLSVLVSQPFSDTFEDAMDVFCRFTNTFNAFVGVIGARHFLSTATEAWLQSTALIVVNVVNIAVILFVFFSTPIRAWWSRRKATIEAQRQMNQRRQTQSSPQDTDVAVGANAVAVQQQQQQQQADPLTTSTTNIPTSRPPPAISKQFRHASKSRGALRHKQADVSDEPIPLDENLGSMVYAVDNNTSMLYANDKPEITKNGDGNANTGVAHGDEGNGLSGEDNQQARLTALSSQVSMVDPTADMDVATYDNNQKDVFQQLKTMTNDAAQEST